MAELYSLASLVTYRIFLVRHTVWSAFTTMLRTWWLGRWHSLGVAIIVSVFVSFWKKLSFLCCAVARVVAVSNNSGSGDRWSGEGRLAGRRARKMNVRFTIACQLVTSTLKEEVSRKSYAVVLNESAARTREMNHAEWIIIWYWACALWTFRN